MKNCMTYWFPRLSYAGVPVPKTEMVGTSVELVDILDGKKPEGWDGFIGLLRSAAERIGLPAFLRTGQTSNKHHWSKTCHLIDLDALESHVCQLVEFSAMCDFIGLPCDVWAVREMLPTKPICTLPAYHGFPLVREVRAFVGDGKILGWHPYWPNEAVIKGFPRKFSKTLDEPERDVPPNIADIIAQAHAIPWEDVRPMVQSVADVFSGEGEWSVDVLETDRGWHVTDMAEKSRSFHWVEGMRVA